MQATDCCSWTLKYCAASLLLWCAAGTAFTQTPADHVQVADVLIQGSEMTPAVTVKSYLKTRAGSPYNADVVQDDTRTLVATRLFADVRVQVEELSHERVNVHFLLRDPPRTIRRIEYRGAKHLSDDELKALTGLAVGAPLRPAANKLACQLIARKYRDTGRPFADCYLLTGSKDSDTDIVFVITEGPKFQINDLRFAGNSFVSGDVLATHIRSSPTLIFGFSGDYNRELIDNDVGKLHEYYHSFGFHDVRISPEVCHQPDGCNITVVFHIVEGVRYRVKGVPSVVGSKRIPKLEELEEVLKVKAGEFYDGGKLKRGADEVRDWYGWQGFDAHVEVVNSFSPHEPGVVRVQYEVADRERGGR